MSNFFKLAENVLNNLDQQTSTSIQTVLNKKNDSDSRSPSLSSKKKSTSNKQSTLSDVESNKASGNNQMRSNYSTPALAYQNPSARSSTSSISTLKSTKEDELIEFLNNGSLTVADASSKSSSKSHLDKHGNFFNYFLTILTSFY
jgi:hypothetical protein